MGTTLLAGAFFNQGFFRTLVFLMLAFLWGFALYDLAKRHMSGWHKAFWLLVIVLIPLLGALIYLVTRPGLETEQIAVSAGYAGREGEDMAMGGTHHPGI